MLLSRFSTALRLCLLATVALLASSQNSAAQAVNPTFIEFTSLDHNAINFYEVCFYPTATSTTPTRCNRVPVTQAVVMPTANLYRLPRASWASNLPFNTDLFPRVRTVSGDEVVGGEVAPTVAPFSFRLQVRPVSNVTLVP